MENLSCHWNQSAWATAIKNNVLVDSNVRNNTAKFQLYYTASEKLIFEYMLLQILPIDYHDNQSN